MWFSGNHSTWLWLLSAACNHVSRDTPSPFLHSSHTDLYTHSPHSLQLRHPSCAVPPCETLASLPWPVNTFHPFDSSPKPTSSGKPPWGGSILPRYALRAVVTAHVWHLLGDYWMNGFPSPSDKLHKKKDYVWFCSSYPEHVNISVPGIQEALKYLQFQFSSVQFSHSVTSDSLWPHGLQHTCLSITNSRSLVKLKSIESVMPSNHLILCHPLLLLPLIFPRIRVFFFFFCIRVFSNESVLGIRWPKYWSFSSSISPSKEYSGLISFRVD